MDVMTLAVQLLAKWCLEGPKILSTLNWDVSPALAVADLDQTGDIRMKPNPDKPGSWMLVVIRGVPVLPLVNELHALGWKRGSDFASIPGWELYAYTEQDGAQVRLHGLHFDSERWDSRLGSLPFFADPPPRLSRRKTFKAEYDAWLAKCHNDEW